MGDIFYVMGKSATGKDTIYKKLLKRLPFLRTVTLYTTRPPRNGETDGVEYHFTTRERLDELRGEGQVIEERTYQTVHGPWTYFTADDGQICLNGAVFYLMIGTLESYEKMREYFGKDRLFPVYIQVEDGERLARALKRERNQKHPRYQELCRRFLADEQDFKEENLLKNEIRTYYENEVLKICLDEICRDIETWFAAKCKKTEMQENG